jgi:small redox-active disulfide protein 2
MGMKREIKVLGPGCPKCELLYENVVKALDELGVEADIIKIKDFMQIAAHGVLTTPGLVVDGKLVSQGKVLSVEEIKEILKG